MTRLTISNNFNIRIMKMCTISLLSVFVFTGCFRGTPFDKPPIHLNPNMDIQPKYRALGPSEFFENGSAMRTPVAGTVARNQLKEDTEYYTGKDDNGILIAKNPETISKELLLKGQERYNIYCAPCHSATGDGKGIVTKYEFIPPPTDLHTELVLDAADGHLFDVITNGIRNMQGYKAQIKTADRWAIVSYVRALQRSQNATANDVPENQRNR